jgi:tetraacyldisaccharide 4'-kinase
MFRNRVIQILLSPLSLIYGVIVYFVHYFYETGLLKGSSFSIPVIGVGNLSIGGAGKTPHVEYLIELYKDYINVATLSRGYKRTTRGFRQVQTNDTALTVGDEPLQYKRKYQDVTVAVSESRAYAIPQILQSNPDTHVILLDDAFQHRTVKPGLNIMLTPYDQLFTRDYLLPSGRLREWRSGYRRADIIIVTKCPQVMTTEDKNKIIAEIKPFPYQKIFFSYYKYGYPYSFFDPMAKISLDKELDVILLSAIANTNYVLDYLDTQVKNTFEIEYEDHHNFDTYDIERIVNVYKEVDQNRRIILTTEKDAMRLEPFMKSLYDQKIPVYILPVKVVFHFDEQALFDQLMKQFILNFKV